MDVFGHIAKFCDFETILSLRHSCKAIYCQILPVGLHLTKETSIKLFSKFFFFLVSKLITQLFSERAL